MCLIELLRFKFPLSETTAGAKVINDINDIVLIEKSFCEMSADKAATASDQDSLHFPVRFLASTKSRFSFSTQSVISQPGA